MCAVDSRSSISGNASVCNSRSVRRARVAKCISRVRERTHRSRSSGCAAVRTRMATTRLGPGPSMVMSSAARMSLPISASTDDLCASDDSAEAFSGGGIRVQVAASLALARSLASRSACWKSFRPCSVARLLSSTRMDSVMLPECRTDVYCVTRGSKVSRDGEV